MPRSSFYSVSFSTPAGETIVSRSFSTLRAARKWAAFLLSRPSMAVSAKIYRGGAGGELLEAA